MYLKSLQLFNFKNYEEARLQFSDKVNVLVGTNGSGKTNLLDAIYYLSLTKSAFSFTDTQLIKHSQKFFSIKGTFEKSGTSNEILCALQAGGKKVIKEGVNEYQKLSEHIGKYPVVLVAPDDVELVREGSEERRRFFDTLISQIDKPYLESLIRYNHVLKQRNSLLKMFAESGKIDPIALDSYDKAMVPAGQLLFEKRNAFIEQFIPVFLRYFNLIVDHREEVRVAYSSDISSESFAEGLLRNREKDLVLQRSNFGPHKDDFLFSLAHGELKKLGSQGQVKSFLLALKLAQYEILEQHTGTAPILLLDDIFDKLDDHRIAQLLKLVGEGRFSQIFITDARPERTMTLLDEIGVEASIFTVENGTVSEE